MHKLVEDLVTQINSITKDKPIFYFCRDAERALGLENLLQSFQIICIEDSYIVDQLEKEGFNIYSTEKLGILLNENSTKELVKNLQVQDRIRSITNNSKFFAQFFQYQKPTELLIKSLGGKILNNSPEINRQFEDKLTQFKFFKEIAAKTPKSGIFQLGNQTFEELSRVFGGSFVVQFDRSYTGKGTFIIETEEDFYNLKRVSSGNSVKISQFISGNSYTINGVCRKNGEILVGPLQYQITGYLSLASSTTTTLGNDWSFAQNVLDEIKTGIYEEVIKIGRGLCSKGYLGHFGVDLMISEVGEIFIIEVNCRQTANSSLETKLAIQQGKVPLMLLHIAEFMGLDYSVDKNDLQGISGSQVFLRAKKEGVVIHNELKSGLYRLQSDNSAIDWETLIRKDDVIYLDEEMDKPLIWQRDAYTIEADKPIAGFLLLCQKKGSKKENSEEIARMQFTDQIIFDDKLSPWVLEAFSEIERLIL